MDHPIAHTGENVALRGSMRFVLRHRRVRALLVAALTAFLVLGAGALRPVTTRAAGAPAPTSLHIVNYYPAQHAWDLMWTSFDPAEIDTDFGRVAGLGATTVRVIVQSGTFGYPVVSATRAAQLQTVLSIAANHGLDVELTLFDGFSSYTDISGSITWATSLLTPLANDPRVALVELKNEMDPSDPAAMAWARALIPVVRSLSGDPVSVSVTQYGSGAVVGTLAAALAGATPDAYDYHFYGPAYTAHAVLAQAQAAAGSVPLLIGETGYPTTPGQTGEAGIPTDQASQEAFQEYYYRTVYIAARDLGLPAPAPWMLDDLASTACTVCPARERNFGLYHLDGSAKAAAAVVAAAFSGAPISTDIDNDFEEGGATPLLWHLDGASVATLSTQTGYAHTGAYSARITASGDANDGLGPAYYAMPPSAVVPGSVHTLGVWMSGWNATGANAAVIVWEDANLHVISKTWSPKLPGGNQPWTWVQVSSVAPANAALVRISLSSINNSGTVWFDDVSWS